MNEFVPLGCSASLTGSRQVSGSNRGAWLVIFDGPSHTNRRSTSVRRSSNAVLDIAGARSDEISRLRVIHQLPHDSIKASFPAYENERAFPSTSLLIAYRCRFHATTAAVALGVNKSATHLHQLPPATSTYILPIASMEDLK